MASKTNAALALFLTFNLLFFTFASACGGCRKPKPPKPSPTPGPPSPTPTPPTPTPTPTPPTPTPTPTPPTPTPSPPSPGSGGTCPINALKLGVCANVLNGLLNITLGQPPRVPCCPLLSGLVDLEAAVCLCTALRANILGINLNIPIDLSLLLNYCGRNVPRGFQCP